MVKRYIIFGDYNTAVQGWTLTSWALGNAPQVTNWVDVPGRIKGPLNLSTALTDGEPRYGSRPLTVTLESSEGTRLEREARINDMTNWLDGWTLDIVLPDDPGHYLRGVLSVAKSYNDPAHCAVQITGICEPWRYDVEETVINLTPSDEAQTATLVNLGRMAVVPLLTVADGTVNLTFGTSSWALSAGTYALPDMYLTPGEHQLVYSGSGSLSLKWRGAVL